MVPFKGHDMFTMGWLHPPPTWRIILVSKWLVTMVIVSPLSRFAPLTNGLWFINGGSLTTYSRPGMTIQVGIRSPKWRSRWGIRMITSLKTVADGRCLWRIQTPSSWYSMIDQTDVLKGKTPKISKHKKHATWPEGCGHRNEKTRKRENEKTRKR